METSVSCTRPGTSWSTLMASTRVRSCGVSTCLGTRFAFSLLHHVHHGVLHMMHALRPLQLQNLGCLSNLPCMGYLNVSDTGVTFQQLLPLRSMFIVELFTDGNSELEVPGLTRVQNRLVLVHLFPRVWVLNGVYITLEERRAASELFKSADQKLLQATRCVALPFSSHG